MRISSGGAQVDREKPELRWRIDQQLGWIEFRLFWEKQVSRRDPIEQFGVSVNKPSTDLKCYVGFAPDNIVCNRRAWIYVLRWSFKPHFLEPDASRYLARLLSVVEAILDREDSWIAKLSPATMPACSVNRKTLQSRMDAIQRPKAIKVMRALLYYALRRLGLDTDLGARSADCAPQQGGHP